MSVTVISCVYGDYARFMAGWSRAISNLDPEPDDVRVVGGACSWEHPQAFYLNEAVAHADTDWVWQVDIDDIAHPNALKGLAQVRADVWQMGFDRSDGERYVPPVISNDDYLASDRNVYVAGSAVRVDAFREVGGFPDVALQDWALWRRLARAGKTFQVSGRTHFRYMRHDATRGATELTVDARPDHLAEMMEAELAAV